MHVMKMGLAALLLAIGASAWANGPAGSGNVELGMGWTPTYDQGDKASDQKTFMLQGDFPLWSGLQGQLGANLGYNYDQINASSGGETQSQTDNAQSYGWNAQIHLYPAAFAGLDFVPGENADPDGWLYWPSLTLGYSATDLNAFSAFALTGSFNTQGQAGVYAFAQTLNYGLTLPLATWLTVSGSYERNLRMDQSQSYSPTTSTWSGVFEGEGVEADVYLNLVPGAGADKDRPYLPHFGRLGQLVVSLAWSRMAYPGKGVSDENSYSLGVGAPVSSSLGVVLGAAQDNQDSNATRTYDLALTWAFGDPAGRVGR